MIQDSARKVLSDLERSIEQLTDQQYCQKIDLLSGASIGQHVRHVLEMLICLQRGYDSGMVNYENRKRDPQMETCRRFATAVLQTTARELHQNNRELLLQSSFDDKLTAIRTNYFREIAFNIEHAIHHMALIRIGIETLSTLQLPESFGVASSTLKYRKTSAASSSI